MGAGAHAKLLNVVPSCPSILHGSGVAHQDADRYVDRRICL